MQSATLSPGELATIAFNQKHDVKAGYTISFKAPSLRSKGAIGLTAPKDMSQKEVDENWKEFGDEILLINNVVHLKIIALPLETPAALNLTKRQIQVLQWVSDGKTLQDVSILLNISPATVEKHLRLARQGLGVETTAQAIMKTVRQNQIHITKRS
jgi:LuxR family transcriptional regulator